ncbi:CCCH zinc finger and SMR domain-containing protein [Arthroderma uncinatum]|uniref:CCCH zinc finger and SMR domain-containing protein n=1 Tax=Arthroderma uncinatum TaxID=74035 RepID=UPI00144A7158|nr:CCCH zinc finger and SMR domain-containing protein [Arthroderma uncinatum]KAF3491802.1 CCCH zinc finger and SMR domain-containing protein [Arthroderma uncinatum]
MASEETYELCLRILDNEEDDEEEKVEKLEAFLREQSSLTDTALENAVLDILWRHRNSSMSDAALPPVRHTVIRRSSPAPWQMARSSTPLSSPSHTGSSPVAQSGFPVPRGGFPRAPRSLTASPFTSPRPSPRLGKVLPIPHSPNLNTYSFSDRGPAPEIYGDLGSDNVDWLVNEDARSTASSTGLSAAAPEWVAPPDMGPYDILRSVLGERKTNEEIEQALETNGYDLGATIASLTEQDHLETPLSSSNEGRVLIGKSTAMDPARPMTPSGSTRTPVVCKYWLSTGQCLRMDCRFSHDLTSHVCKYWLMGNCLAGESCPFSHDPSSLIGGMTISNDSLSVSGYTGNSQQNTYPLQDNYEAFPPLQPPSTTDQWQSSSYQMRSQMQFMAGSPQMRPGSSSSIKNKNVLNQATSRSHSRPTSKHQNRESSNTSAPAVDDPEAFPTLQALNARPGKKHHGKRGNQHREVNKSKETSGSLLADAVRMSPSTRRSVQKGTRSSASSTREISAEAQAIPSPKHIPWLETGVQWTQPYLKYRVDAITHGNVRNKFLQSAAQAWNRNDARAAKALSLRGQAENDAMRRCHREAARLLYEEGRKHIDENDDEFYIDLHGLVPTEAIAYLDNILKESAQLRDHYLYVITGSGHHSKNGKDKVGKAVKGWLTEHHYVFRDFSVPGERGGFVAFVIGINPAATTASGRNSPSPATTSKALNTEHHVGEINNAAVTAPTAVHDEDDEDGSVAAAEASSSSPEPAPLLKMGKIRLLKRDGPATKV